MDKIETLNRVTNTNTVPRITSVDSFRTSKCKGRVTLTKGNPHRTTLFPGFCLFGVFCLWFLLLLLLCFGFLLFSFSLIHEDKSFLLVLFLSLLFQAEDMKVKSMKRFYMTKLITLLSLLAGHLKCESYTVVVVVYSVSIHREQFSGIYMYFATEFSAINF